MSLEGVSKEVSTSALKSKEDNDDEQDENDALDDSVEILRFSFRPVFKLVSYNELTILHKPNFSNQKYTNIIKSGEKQKQNSDD